MVGGADIPGGHRVQLEQTARHLRLLGVEAHVSLEVEPRLECVDLVHGFDLCASDIRRCSDVGLPVVLSTIYWDKAYVTGQSVVRPVLRTWTGRLRTGLVLLRSALLGRHIEKCEAYVDRLTTERVSYEMADLLLPNSCAEASRIRSDLGVTTPCHVVPNAVDHHGFTADNVADWSIRNGAVCVGRLEPHKNQLGLISAMRGSHIGIRIVGPPHPHHQKYHASCIQRIGQRVEVLPGVPHEELSSIYRSARVHVLPSWFETTGLVSLEAALCGCNIVTTNRGYAREYFGDLAWYCDPADPRSIRRAVEEAYAAPFREELRERILANYTWEHTARATLAGYERVLTARRLPLPRPTAPQ